MSEQDSQPDASPVEGFDVYAVALGAAFPPVLDELGRSHFPWSAGELSVAPSGRSARCDVALIDRAGQMAYRRLVLDTEGAVLLARTMLALTLQRDDTEAPAPR